MTPSLIIAAATGAIYGLDGITWWCVLAFVALVVVLGLAHRRRPRSRDLFVSHAMFRPSDVGRRVSGPGIPPGTKVTSYIDHHHVRILAGPFLFDQDAA